MRHVHCFRSGILNPYCSQQIKLHFGGPDANKLEQDFNKLLRTGKLHGPSVFIPGFVADPNRKTK